VLQEYRQWGASAGFYTIRHLLNALGMGHITGMADTFARFEARPAYMVEHPAFDYFWACLLPAGTPLTQNARDAMQVVAHSLCMHANIELEQAVQVVATTIGARTFDALMRADRMPTDPLIGLHGRARRPWHVFTMRVDPDTQQRLFRAAESRRLHAELDMIVRACCRIAADARAHRGDRRLDDKHNVYTGDMPVGLISSDTPEQHAQRWAQGAASGHLDRLLLGQEGGEAFVCWLTTAIETGQTLGTPPAMTMSIKLDRKHGEALPACVADAGDLGQYTGDMA
jgi:hypothetical protein